MQITEKQKQQLIDLNDSRVNEILNLTPQLNKWYKVSNSKFMIYLTKYVGLNECEGFYFGADSGEYKGFSDYLGFRDCVLCTEQEVEQALIYEAKRRGYKNGNYECLLSDTIEVVNKYFLDEDYCLWHGMKNNANLVFEKGQWAEIIDDKAELKQEIKELRNKLKSLEEKL